MAAPTPEDVSWPELHRVRRAIVVVDVVESVRLMQANEADVIDRWRRFVAEVRTQVLPKHGGRMVKSLGDGMLLEFETAPAAVAAAFELRSRIAGYNVSRSESEALWLRMGVHVAEVVSDELDVWGIGVNTAARIAGLAGPSCIYLSVEARDELADGIDATLHDRGHCFVKHMDEPLRVFEALPAGGGPVFVPSLPRDSSSLGISVAVMPFSARGNEPESIVIGDLIADQVSASISRSANLRVISRMSALVVGRRQLDANAAGQLLGADYLITGTVYRISDQVHVLAELVESTSQEVVWSGPLRAPMADILAGNDTIVPQLVSEVGRSILDREISRSTSAPLPSLDSHHILMAAVGLIHRNSRLEFARAETLLEVLAERHKRRPHGYAWLAHWHAMTVVQGLAKDPTESAKRAYDFGQRALEADPGSALALTMVGLVQGFMLRNLEAADQHYQRALELNPNEALAWLYVGTLRAWQGRGAEALDAAKHALALAPHDPMRYYFDSLAGLAALAAGDNELAANWSRRSLRAHCGHTSTHRTLAIAQWKLGQEDAARATVIDMLRVEPGFTVDGYLARFPGGHSPMARENAEILLAAGAARH